MPERGLWYDRMQKEGWDAQEACPACSRLNSSDPPQEAQP